MQKRAKRIPIKAAKDITKEFGYSVAVIVAWDAHSGTQHVTTYGDTVENCRSAANLGNMIKEDVLMWPSVECHAVPSRLKKKS